MEILTYKNKKKIRKQATVLRLNRMLITLNLDARESNLIYSISSQILIHLH